MTLEHIHKAISWRDSPPPLRGWDGLCGVCGRWLRESEFGGNYGN